MKIVIITSLFLSSINTCFAISGADFEWSVASNRNGIKVYRANKHKSGIVPIKVETVLPYPPSRVLAVIADTNRKTEWVPQLSTAKTIESKSIYDKIEYTVYNSPWPFSDRSFLIHINAITNKKDKSLLIKLNSIESKAAPKNPTYVRGFTYNGDIVLKNNGKGKAYFQVMFLTDFRGDIPKWIVNMVQQGWPKKMIKSLRRQLSRKDIIIPEEFKYLD